MQRKLFVIFAVVLIIVSTVSVALALGGGNGRKGKFLYRKHCYQACHKDKADELSPATYTQAEWAAHFKDTAKISCYAQWPDISDADLNDITTYLHDGAKDSPSPAKCS